MHAGAGGAWDPLWLDGCSAKGALQVRQDMSWWGEIKWRGTRGRYGAGINDGQHEHGWGVWRAIHIYQAACIRGRAVGDNGQGGLHAGDAGVTIGLPASTTATWRDVTGMEGTGNTRSEASGAEGPCAAGAAVGKTA